MNLPIELVGGEESIGGEVLSVTLAGQTGAVGAVPGGAIVGGVLQLHAVTYRNTVQVGEVGQNI